MLLTVELFEVVKLDAYVVHGLIPKVWLRLKGSTTNVLRET